MWPGQCNHRSYSGSRTSTRSIFETKSWNCQLIVAASWQIIAYIIYGDVLLLDLSYYQIKSISLLFSYMNRTGSVLFTQFQQQSPQCAERSELKCITAKWSHCREVSLMRAFPQRLQWRVHISNRRRDLRLCRLWVGPVQVRLPCCLLLCVTVSAVLQCCRVPTYSPAAPRPLGHLWDKGEIIA